MASKSFELRNRTDRPHMVYLPVSKCWHAESKWACAAGDDIHEAYMNWSLRDKEVQAYRAANNRRRRK